MGRKAKNGEVNKSAAIREILKQNPKIKATDAIAALAEQGIKVKVGLFYIVKGKALGRKKRRRKNQAKVVDMMAATGNGDVSVAAHALRKADALTTIKKIKSLAGEVGGLRVLKQLVDVLNER